MALIEAASPHTMNTYGRLPIALSHGQGVRVWDMNGKRVPRRAGRHRRQHAGPQPPQAGARPAGPGRQDHPQLQLLPRAQPGKAGGQAGGAVGPDQRVLLLTGLEANEAAIKLARKFGHDRGIERPEIVVYEKAFHGRSIATLSATGNEKVQKGFGPLVEGFIRVPLNDIEALKKRDRGQPQRGGRVLRDHPGRRRHQPDAHRLPAAGAPAVRPARLAADDRRGAVRHGPHRQVVRPPVGRHQARRDAAGQGPGLGRADRARWWPARRPPTSSSRATTAPPSAATRWRCARASRRSASWRRTACWTTPPAWART